TAIAYSIVVLLVSAVRPDIVPRHEKGAFEYSMSLAVREIWPVLVLGVLIFGGLCSGDFTATEAGDMGAAGAIVIAWVLGRLDLQTFKTALLETLSTTSTLLIIGVGATMFTVFLSLSGVASAIGGLLDDWTLGYLEMIFIIIAV